jgi:hypothetical protein
MLSLHGVLFHKLGIKTPLPLPLQLHVAPFHVTLGKNQSENTMQIQREMCEVGQAWS